MTRSGLGGVVCVPTPACLGSGGGAGGLLGRILFLLSGRVGSIVEGVGVVEVQLARVALLSSVSGSRFRGSLGRSSGTVGGRTISIALGRGSLERGSGSMIGRFSTAWGCSWERQTVITRLVPTL